MNRLLTFLTFLALSNHAIASETKGSSSGWWRSINEKTARIFEAESRLSKLEEEHKKLKADYTRLESDYKELQNKWEVEKREAFSLKDTGSKEGVSPESIHYQIPAGLSDEQLYRLGLEHFREKRFMEAGVIFDQLENVPEFAQNAELHYTSGVAWFQLKNYRKSKENFEAAKSSASSEKKEKIKKKIDLWMRVIDSRLASATPAEGAEDKGRMPAGIPSIQPPSKHEDYGTLPTEPKEVGSRPMSPEEAAHHEDSSNHH